MPLTLTRAQWEGCIARVGMPGRLSWSAPLRALADALGQHAASARGKRADAAAAAAANVRSKFEAWDGGDHPGEHDRLKSTPEYAQLQRELGAAGADVAEPAPPRAMLLVTWNCRHGSDWHGLVHAERTRRLGRVIKGAYDVLARLPADSRTEGPVKIVLVAPEYQYTARANTRAPMPEEMKVAVESSLRAMSRMHPSVLLVAGSSHYFKDEHRPSLASQYKVDPSTGLRSVRKPDATRRAKAGRKLVDAWQMHEEMGKDHLNTQTSVATHPRTGKIIVSVPSMHSVADVLLDEDSAPRIVRNVAYMFLAGSRIAKYDKQTDYSEALNNSPDAMMFIPGTNNECPVVGGRRYGLEICLDHDTGVLKNRNVADLQFHLVMSDSVRTRPGHMAMSRGGYFVHASTDASQACVYQRSETGALVRMTPSYSEDAGDGGVDFYAVYEPAPTLIG